MLTITPAASEAITALLGPAAVPEGSGLRLIRGPAQPDGAAIGLSVAEQPGPQDQVLDAGGGADLFLDPETADLLDDKELDAQLEGDRVIFSFRPQSTGDGGW